MIISFLLEKEVVKWELKTLSVADAWQFKKSAFDMVWCVGFGLARGHEVKLDSLPYLYGIMQTACFRSGCHVCFLTDAAACAKLLVMLAFKRNGGPCSEFRRVSPATIIRLGFGDEVSSSSLAASMLGRCCRALVVPQQPLRQCLKCFGAK